MQAGGHTASWHSHSFVCCLLQTALFHDVFQWMVFISISKPCLSSPVLFFFFFFCCFAWLCLWSRIGLGSKTVLEKETAFPDFCILHLSSQLPKGLLSWPAGSLRDGKHICFWANHEQPPPIAIMMNVFTYSPTLWYYTKLWCKDLFKKM